MVSLGQNFNMSSGARFLTDNPNNSGDDRQQLLDPIHSTDNRDYFIPLKTIPAFSYHLLISIIISLTGIGLAAVWPYEKRCEAYFIMLYLRAAFWAITCVFDHVVKRHHDNLRLNGYHEFHRITAMHKGIPLYVVSLWNTVILVVEAIMQHYYSGKFVEHCFQSFFSPLIYITTFSVLETMVLASVNGSYIARVREFNKAAPQPDALQGSHLEGVSLGLVQPGANIADLFEKQADLISYLKDHNFKLNQKLIALNAQVRIITMQDP